MDRKYLLKYTLLGMLMPGFGIIIAKNIETYDVVKGCSIRRGSAIMTLIIFLALMTWLVLTVFLDF